MNVVVVGAGPGGLMAAEVLASAGHRVSVFDQRRSPARKFVLAGRGGLNITHSEPIDLLLDRYGPARAHLEPMIHAFDSDALRSWCAELGEETFIGTSGRVFPESFRAVPLLRAWLRRLDGLGVMFELGQRWLGWDEASGGQAMVFVDDGGSTRSVEFDVAVLALGGASWPRVGADGSWVDLLTERGVDIVPLQPANCGVRFGWSQVMLDRFAGAPVKNAAVIVDGVTVRGDPIVSSGGLEGGPIYAHSRRLRELFDATGEAQLVVDLLPDLELGDLVRRLVERWRKKRSISTWLSRCGVSAVGVALMREVTMNTLPSDPDELAGLVKAVTLSIDGLASIDRAISTAGGVSWSSIDDDLQLRASPGTYVVGEMLDWEAPTGGYLLQAVFSTAHHAATRAG